MSGSRLGPSTMMMKFCAFKDCHLIIIILTILRTVVMTKESLMHANIGRRKITYWPQIGEGTCMTRHSTICGMRLILPGNNKPDIAEAQRTQKLKKKKKLVMIKAGDQLYTLAHTLVHRTMMYCGMRRSHKPRPRNARAAPVGTAYGWGSCPVAAHAHVIRIPMLATIDRRTN